MCETPECSQIRVFGNNLCLPKVCSSAVSRRRSLERLPGRDQCTLRTGEEDVTGPGTGVPTAVRVQLYLSLACEPLWPERQLRSPNVACHSGADKEAAGSESTWRSYSYGLGNRLSCAGILVCRRCCRSYFAGRGALRQAGSGKHRIG